MAFGLHLKWPCSNRWPRGGVYTIGHVQSSNFLPDRVVSWELPSCPKDDNSLSKEKRAPMGQENAIVTSLVDVMAKWICGRRDAAMATMHGPFISGGPCDCGRWQGGTGCAVASRGAEWPGRYRDGVTNVGDRGAAFRSGASSVLGGPGCVPLAATCRRSLGRHCNLPVALWGIAVAVAQPKQRPTARGRAFL